MIVGLARVRQKRPSAHLLHGPREHRRCDELDYARLVARRFGTDHHGVLVDEDAMRTFIPELVYHQDEPLADWTGIPQHFVTRLARDTAGYSGHALFVGPAQGVQRRGRAALAWSRVEAPVVRLRTVHNGPLEHEVRAAAARNPRIELVGYVPHEQLPRELAGSRCLALPSVTTRVDREPWGLVVNEAMHAGRAVVVSDAVGAAAGGLVQHGRNGLVVREKDTRALREALELLLRDPHRAKRLGEQART